MLANLGGDVAVAAAGQGLEPLERGTIDQAAWWTPDALDADGTAANKQLTTMMRAAVRRILGEA